MAWGYLTTIDLKQCEPEMIRSEKYIKQYVKELIDLIKMRAYGDTTVVHFGSCPEVEGFTMVQMVQMVQMIETSLISAHFVNQTNDAFIDIFSCKPYDEAKAGVFTQNFFMAKTMVRRTIKRG